MKILLITGYFPPYCPAATTRAPSFARFLLKQGHDVRVICPYLPQYPAILEAGLEAGRIHYVPLKDIDDAPRQIKSWLKGRFKTRKDAEVGHQEVLGQGVIYTSEAPRQRSFERLRSTLNYLYTTFLHFPDRQWTWVRPAHKVAKQLLSTWRADIIYVSTPPYSQLFLARRLAREFNIPWALEYRDAWVVQPYYSYPWVRKIIEGWVEKWVTKSAKTVFAVTYLAAYEMSRAIGRDIICARNGYDPEDFESLSLDGPLDDQRLTILYGGAVYGGRRDPTPLFKALNLVENAARNYRVILHTDQHEQIAAAAKTLGVEHVVDLRPAVSRQEFLKSEVAADVLLFLRGADKDEDSVIPGKLYEYIGAKRPILALGSLTGEAVEIIRQENLGLVSNRPEEIAAQLSRWHQQKLASGGQLPPTDIWDRERYSRERQFEIILQELTRNVQR